MKRAALICEPPQLDWSRKSGPQAVNFDDIYYSAEDGLEETRAVFLQGCGFPEAWAARASYVVAELGFGTGLNALALWQLWARTAPAGAWLHFISVEKHPLRRADAARAFEAWPELKPFSQRLLKQWPTALKGAHRLVFPEDRFSITLFQDEAEAALSQIEAKVDAWFLDGFAPAKNQSMWSPEVFEQIGLLSAPNARIGTFTVAGAVRRGLESAGFQVDKKPGFGRKRERLEAIYHGTPTPVPASPWASSLPVEGRIAIIGAGIAGASLAHALRHRERDVVVIDPLGPAGGASGGPAGLLTPRLERSDEPHVRATLAAFDFARRLYDGLDGFYPEGAMRLAKDEADGRRLEELASLLGEGYAWDGRGLWMETSGRFEPARLVSALLGDTPLVRRQLGSIESGADGERLISSTGQAILDADAVVYAIGAAASDVCPAVTPSAGQLAIFNGQPPAFPSVWSGYACAAPDGGVMLGSTHVPGTDAGPFDEAVAEFRSSATRFVPNIAASLHAGVRAGWSGVRASTPDFLPLLGALPAPHFEQVWRDRATGGRAAVASAPRQARRFILGGMGSRGFAHAPLLAEALASELCGEPGPLERSGREVFHPARFIWRTLKRSH
jgi:tRNA 5-methylaminomethyl-2-thiouridine biosynthesis bifunctional protein